MQDDLIDSLVDDSGYELGMPTIEDILRHECDLMHSELEVTRRDVRQSHKNLAGMIRMWRDNAAERSALKAEKHRIEKLLGEYYEADRKKKPALGYAYGNYEKK